MIFVTVGLHPDGFDRLVQAADEMASWAEETVVIQRGGTEYTPRSTPYFDFADEAQMQQWLSEARVVVLHGGAGSIINALRSNKPLVVAPRLKRFGEVIDDHQLELAEVLSRQGKAIAVMDVTAEALWQAIVQSIERWGQAAGQASANHKLQDTLRAWLAEQATPSTRRARWFFRRSH